MRSGYTKSRAVALVVIARRRGHAVSVEPHVRSQGGAPPDELELAWLEGYESRARCHATPRMAVLDSSRGGRHVHLAARRDCTNEHGWQIECELLHFLESAWKEPDEGIWEIRGPRRHFTHSKAMAWLAVDRMIASAQRFGLQGPIDRWKQLRATIHEDVCRNGYDAERIRSSSTTARRRSTRVC